MKGFVLTGEGKVEAGWIDRNQHMNMARYLVLFDDACDALLVSSGLLTAESDLTFVAGRVQMAHRRELFEGDDWQVWSGFASVTDQSMVFVHRMTSGGGVRATCEILSSPFSMKNRTRAVLSEGQTKPLRGYVVPGVIDPFTTMLAR